MSASKTVVQQLSEAQAQIKALETERDQANATVKENEQRINALTQELTDAKTERDAKTTQLTEALNAKTAVDAQLTEAKAKVAELEANAKTVNQKAGEKLAELGVTKPLAIAPDAATDRDTVLAQLEAITDPQAKQDFYEKNRDIITPKNQQAQGRNLFSR